LLAPILFLTGLAAIGTSTGMAFKQQSDWDKQARESQENGYSYTVQSRYDYNRGKLYAAYNPRLVMDAIKADYPKMNDFCARQVAEAAIAKYLMESETKYKYEVPSNCRGFDLGKYIKDEYKTTERNWWIV